MPRTLTVNILCPKCDSVIGRKELQPDVYHQTYRPIASLGLSLYCPQCGGTFLVRDCEIKEVRHD